LDVASWHRWLRPGFYPIGWESALNERGAPTGRDLAPARRHGGTKARWAISKDHRLSH
jgi:hypothetical protein